MFIVIMVLGRCMLWFLVNFLCGRILLCVILVRFGIRYLILVMWWFWNYCFSLLNVNLFFCIMLYILFFCSWFVSGLWFKDGVV